MEVEFYCDLNKECHLCQFLNLYLAEIFHMLPFSLLYLLYLRIFCCKIRKKISVIAFPLGDTGDNSHPCKCGTEGRVFQSLHIVLLSTT